MPSPIDDLIEEIQAETRFTGATTGVTEIDPAVIEALRNTPREHFVADTLKSHAYENHPLPLGYGQTISQPLIVAIMSHMLQPRADQHILEIGTGSGYQAAVLARLVRKVITLEVIPVLAEAAAQCMAKLGIGNVEIHCTDGNLGWSNRAPYDGIIVTACAPVVPTALLAQLKPGGHMIMPIGEPYGYQDLHLIRKAPDGAISMRPVLPVAFVPLQQTAPPSLTSTPSP